MKTFKIKLMSVIGLFAMIFMSGCEDAKNDEVTSPHVYMVTQNGENGERLTIEEEGTNVNLTLRLNKAINADVKINLEVNEDFLNKYNERNGTSYVMLPEEFYAFDSMNVVIQNSAIANAVSIAMKPLSAELNKTGLTYAIPVSITSVEGNKVKVLENGSSYLYIITPIPYADLPVMSRGNGMKMKLKDDRLTLTDYTVEFLVKVDGLGLNRNNQILFNGRTADGKNEIFMRFAADGAAGKWDKFQMKNQGLNFDAKTSFKNNVWYHIACVNDSRAGKTYIYVNGSLDSSFDNPGQSTTIESNHDAGVRFCGEADNDSYMRSNMQGAEIRLWSVARTASEIQNNMYGVDPATPGLTAYWKSNEGSGSEIKDQTGNGHDAVLFGTPRWNLNQRVQVGLGLE